MDWPSIEDGVTTWTATFTCLSSSTCRTCYLSLVSDTKNMPPRVFNPSRQAVVVVIFIGDETVYSFFRTTADAYVEIRLSQNRQSYRGRQGHFTAKKITATTKAFESWKKKRETKKKLINRKKGKAVAVALKTRSQNIEKDKNNRLTNRVFLEHHSKYLLTSQKTRGTKKKKQQILSREFRVNGGGEFKRSSGFYLFFRFTAV